MDAIAMMVRRKDAAANDNNIRAVMEEYFGPPPKDEPHSIELDDGCDDDHHVH